MKNFSLANIILEVASGAEISQCCHEAAQIALQENRVVTFIHNGKHYTANPEILIGVVWNTAKQ